MNMVREKKRLTTTIFEVKNILEVTLINSGNLLQSLLTS